MNKCCQEQQEQVETVFQGSPEVLKIALADFLRVFGENVGHRPYAIFIFRYGVQYIPLLKTRLKFWFYL